MEWNGENFQELNKPTNFPHFEWQGKISADFVGLHFLQKANLFSNGHEGWFRVKQYSSMITHWAVVKCDLILLPELYSYGVSWQQWEAFCIIHKFNFLNTQVLSKNLYILGKYEGIWVSRWSPHLHRNLTVGWYWVERERQDFTMVVNGNFAQQDDSSFPFAGVLPLECWKAQECFSLWNEWTWTTLH